MSTYRAAQKVPSGQGRLPAAILLQILEDGKANPAADILARVAVGEISRERAFCLLHPGLSTVAGLVFALIVFLFVSK